PLRQQLDQRLAREVTGHDRLLLLGEHFGDEQIDEFVPRLERVVEARERHPGFSDYRAGRCSAEPLRRDDAECRGDESSAAFFDWRTDHASSSSRAPHAALALRSAGSYTTGSGTSVPLRDALMRTTRSALGRR